MGTFEGECSHFARIQSEMEELVEAKAKNAIIMENGKLYLKRTHK